jgi:hypothetical protein
MRSLSTSAREPAVSSASIVASRSQSKVETEVTTLNGIVRG